MNSVEASPKKQQKLTAKQRKWIKVYQETLNATEAAMQVYDCKNRDVANAIGAENLAKLSFDKLMDSIGLTDENLLMGIKEGRTATKPVVIGDDVKAVADYATRHKYIETSLKLKNRLTNKLEVTGENGGPIKTQVLAGIGFIPTDTGSYGDAQVAEGSVVGEPEEVQGVDMAQTSQEDNDSD